MLFIGILSQFDTGTISDLRLECSLIIMPYIRQVFKIIMTSNVIYWYFDPVNAIDTGPVLCNLWLGFYVWG